MKTTKALIVAVVCAGFVLPAGAQGPSFDCSKATHPDELTICETPALAELDTIVAAGYGYLKSRYGRPFADQIGIPTWRSRQACQSDANCIRQKQVEAISAYRSAGAPVSVPAWALSTQARTESPYVASSQPQGFSDDEPATPVNVPLQMEGGTFTVPVTINGKINLNFTIDSGASSVVIPADVFGTLIRTGTIDDGDLMGKKTFTLADGSSQTEQTFRIRSLKIGDRILHDVEASVAPVAGDLLLGQTFLRRFKSWSIDNQRGVLVLN